MLTKKLFILLLFLTFLYATTKAEEKDTNYMFNLMKSLTPIPTPKGW